VRLGITGEDAEPPSWFQVAFAALSGALFFSGITIVAVNSSSPRTSATSSWLKVKLLLTALDLLAISGVYTALVVVRHPWLGRSRCWRRSTSIRR